MNNFGKNIRISIFGESHGPLIGLTIDGFPANFSFDIEKIKNALKLRAGHPLISTLRRETDEITFVSGYFNNHTTGEPLTVFIKNTDIKSTDYQEGIIRPSHADLTKYLKTNGANDYRGGGASSGRVTVVLSVLGEMCHQILNTKQIEVVSHIYSIKNINDAKASISNNTFSKLLYLQNDEFPVIDERAKKAMLDLIKKTINKGDSLGGIVETFIFNVPTGLGEPFFDSFESIIAHLLFSIPGVKGIEFGDGFDITKKYGSSTIDELSLESNKINFSSNHQGGINGGISNGNYISFKTAIKAPVSIKQEIKSIDLKNKQNINLTTTGRHDPLFVHRALQVINALTYYGVLDMVIENEK